MILFCVCNVLEFFVTVNMICIYEQRVWFNSCVAAFLKDPTAQAHGKFFVAPANMQIEKSQKKIQPTRDVRASSSRARSNSHQ